MLNIILRILEKVSLNSLTYDKVYNQGFNISTPINLDVSENSN